MTFIDDKSNGDGMNKLRKVIYNEHRFARCSDDEAFLLLLIMVTYLYEFIKCHIRLILLHICYTTIAQPLKCKL